MIQIDEHMGIVFVIEWWDEDVVVTVEWPTSYNRFHSLNWSVERATEFAKQKIYALTMPS